MMKFSREALRLTILAPLSDLASPMQSVHSEKVLRVCRQDDSETVGGREQEEDLA